MVSEVDNLCSFLRRNIFFQLSLVLMWLHDLHELLYNYVQHVCQLNAYTWISWLNPLLYMNLIEYCCSLVPTSPLLDTFFYSCKSIGKHIHCPIFHILLQTKICLCTLVVSQSKLATRYFGTEKKKKKNKMKFQLQIEDKMIFKKKSSTKVNMSFW